MIRKCPFCHIDLTKVKGDKARGYAGRELLVCKHKGCSAYGEIFESYVVGAKKAVLKNATCGYCGTKIDGPIASGAKGVYHVNCISKILVGKVKQGMRGG